MDKIVYLGLSLIHKTPLDSVGWLPSQFQGSALFHCYKVIHGHGELLAYVENCVAPTAREQFGLVGDHSETTPDWLFWRVLRCCPRILQGVVYRPHLNCHSDGILTEFLDETQFFLVSYANKLLDTKTQAKYVNAVVKNTAQSLLPFSYQTKIPESQKLLKLWVATFNNLPSSATPVGQPMPQPDADHLDNVALQLACQRIEAATPHSKFASALLSRTVGPKVDEEIITTVKALLKR